jgi:hypothetical protein
MLSLKSTNEILSSTDALKDISWGWTACCTGLLLFLVLFCNQSGYITGENYYSIIYNDI